LTGGSRFLIERVRLVDEDIAIEGRFDLPPLGTSQPKTRSSSPHSSAATACQQMEQKFSASATHDQNRLNRIARAALPR
jgi:hypothetical protein